MTFTDNDLEWLQKVLEFSDIEIFLSPIATGENGRISLRSLLARLEAAERALRLANPMNERGVRAYDAWRKTCGNEYE